MPFLTHDFKCFFFRILRWSQQQCICGQGAGVLQEMLKIIGWWKKQKKLPQRWRVLFQRTSKDQRFQQIQHKAPTHTVCKHAFFQHMILRVFVQNFALIPTAVYMRPRCGCCARNVGNHWLVKETEEATTEVKSYVSKDKQRLEIPTNTTEGSNTYKLRWHNSNNNDKGCSR